MSQPVKPEEGSSTVVMDDNIREQPVAALPLRRPIRRGLRLNRSSANSDPSPMSFQDAGSSSTLDAQSLFSGVHASAATSAEDACKRLIELEGTQGKEGDGDQDGGEMFKTVNCGRKKKKKFDISSHVDTSSAFAPCQSVADDKESEEVSRITSGAAEAGSTREENRSPTPPPTFIFTGMSSSNTSNDLRTLNSTLGALRQVAPTDLDVLPVMAVPSVSAQQSDLSVKIRHKGTVHRIPMKKTSGVSELVARFSASVGLASPLVTLWCGDDTLSPNHTLQQAGISLTDILDCTVSSEESLQLDGTLERNMVSLKVQDKFKPYAFTLGKAEPLARLLEQYCQASGHTAGRVVLVFDGDRLDLSDTPAGLDMDDGDVVDARLT